MSKIMRIMFRYMPDTVGKPVKDIPGIIEDLFIKAGYQPQHTVEEVENLIKAEVARVLALEEQKEGKAPTETPKVDKPTPEEAKLFVTVDEEPENINPAASQTEDGSDEFMQALSPFLAAVMSELIKRSQDESREDGNGLTPKEIIDLQQCNSQEEFDKVLSGITGSRGGYYPEDWFEKMLVNGLLDAITSKWRK